jgi:hypothetical protein
MLSDPKERDRFDLDGSYPFADMMEKSIKGEIDSWGILWKWAVYRHKGLVLYPSTSLVWVGGFDGTGTHCDVVEEDASEEPELSRTIQLSYPLSWPTEIKIDFHKLGKIKSFLRDTRRKGSMNRPVTGHRWLDRLRKLAR